MSDIELSRDDLPEEFQVMADKIGMENTKILLNDLGGTNVYFPKKQPRRAAARRYINQNFGKQTVTEMSKRTGISRSSIFNYLNSKPRKSR